MHGGAGGPGQHPNNSLTLDEETPVLTSRLMWTPNEWLRCKKRKTLKLPSQLLQWWYYE